MTRLFHCNAFLYRKISSLWRRVKAQKFAIGAVLLVSAAGPQAAESCSVKLSLGNDPEMNFHPTALAYWHARFVAKNTYLTLFDLDIHGQTIPVFAKKWEIDADKKRVRIQLNPSCRWSNGESITARQMVDGIRLLYKVGGLTVGREHIQGSQAVLSHQSPISALSVEVVNEREIEIGYETNFDLLKYALSNMSYTPSYEKLSDIDLEALPEKLPAITSGAYKVEAQSDRQIVLTQNDHFCEGMSGDIQRVKFFRDLPARAEIGAFMQGKIDLLMENHPKNYHSIEKRIEKGEDIKINVLDNDFVSIYLFLNQNNSTLASEKVKQAIKLAIDHELLLSQAIFGRAFALTDSYAPRYQGYQPPEYLWKDAEFYSKRLAEAKALMAAAGYNKENRLKLRFASRKEGVVGAATFALSSMLKQIHIEPDLVRHESVKPYYEALEQGQYDVAFMGWGDVYPDPSQALETILSVVSAPEHIEKRLKEKLERSFTIADRQMRMTTLADIEKDLNTVGNIMPLYRQPAMVLSRSNIGIETLAQKNIRGYSDSNCQP